jgi:phosphoribosylaminoimidazole (AIR) synthetase
MLKVLKCGIGMTLVVNKKDAQSIINDLKKIKLNSSIIGNIIEGKGKSRIEYINI